MEKFRGLPTHYCIREKGTDVWITGYKNGRPFLSHKEAQAWLRGEVRRELTERDRCIYRSSRKVATAEILLACESFEIVPVQLVPPSTVQTPVFQPAEIDAYREGFNDFDPRYDDRWAALYGRNTHKDPLLHRRWSDGFRDAIYALSGSDLIYPEIRALF